MYDTHTCSYHCKRLKCIEAQRDELRDKMDKLIAEAIAAEREACAKVCEDQENKIVKSHPARVEFDPNSYMAKFCAASIRARGEK